MFVRLLARVFNAVPVRWQRRFMSAAHERFLVGVVGLGVDTDGHVLLARHAFGAPQWRFLGGFLSGREAVEAALAREIREETSLEIEVGPILAVQTGYHWPRVELIFPYRIVSGTFAATGEVKELRAFRPDALPDVRADQRAIVERHAATAIAWATRR